MFDSASKESNMLCSSSVCLSNFVSICPSLAKKSSTTISLCGVCTCVTRSISLCSSSFYSISCFVVGTSRVTGSWFAPFHNFCSLPQPILYLLCTSAADNFPLNCFICSTSSGERLVFVIFFCWKYILKKKKTTEQQNNNRMTE